MSTIQGSFRKAASAVVAGVLSGWLALGGAGSAQAQAPAPPPTPAARAASGAARGAGAEPRHRGRARGGARGVALAGGPGRAYVEPGL